MALDLEVSETFDLTPTVRKVRFSSAGLRTMPYEPGQDLMLTVASDGDRRIRRRYSIRKLDRDAATVDLDFALHGNGPGTTWARTARPGDRLDGIGPRGKITVDREASWHVFMGDETSIAATFAMLDALAVGSSASAFIEVPGYDDETALRADTNSQFPVNWLHRGDARPGTSTVLADAADSFELPEGNGHVYLSGEQSMVIRLRDLFVGMGLSEEKISTKPYWRLGRSNAEHGEPERG